MELRFGDMLKARYDNGYWVTADGTYWIVLNDKSVGKTGMIGVIGYDCKNLHKDMRLQLVRRAWNLIRTHYNRFTHLDVHDRARELRRLMNHKQLNTDLYLEFYEVNKKQFEFFQSLAISNKEGARMLKKLGD